MTSKIIVLVILCAFGWAINRSGEIPQTEDRVRVQQRGTRSKRPTKTHTPQMLDSEKETEDTRVVIHALGKTEVPLNPCRIVSLSRSATDGLVALGVKPIMVEDSSRFEGSRVHLEAGLKGVKVFRGGQTVSLEAVSQIRPDLIFVGSGRHGRLYFQCSKIAPTVPIGSSIRSQRERRLLDVGTVLGMSEQAKIRLKAYYKFVHQAKEMLAEKAENEPVVFLRFRRNTCVIYTQTAMFGPLLFEQLGLTPDPKMPLGGASRGWDVLSLERLSTLTSEHIFLVSDRDSEHYLKTISETPVWRDIPAVRHNNVHRVVPGIWIAGDGVMGCEAIIRDVLDGMVPGWKKHAKN